MKDGWKARAFEDCIEPVSYPRKVQRNQFLDGGCFPVISQEESFINGYWNNESDLFRIKGPVIVFGDHTKVLKYIDFDFVLGADGVKILQPKEFLVPKFFFYRLQAEELKSLGYARHYRLLKELTIAYPQPVEQRRIVQALDEAFEAIAVAKANAEKNLQNARAILDGELRAVFISHNRSWPHKELAEFCTFENGDRGTNYPSKSARAATGIPFINAGHLTDDGVDLETMDYISRDRFNLLSNGKVQRGDILFCLRGSLGKFASVGELCEGAIASSLVIVRPDKTVLNDFLIAYFRSPLCTEMINRFKNGAAQPNLSAKSLGRFEIPVPPLDVQMITVHRLTGVREKTQQLANIHVQKLATLHELKKSLLHQAFSGRL